MSTPENVRKAAAESRRWGIRSILRRLLHPLLAPMLNIIERRMQRAVESSHISKEIFELQCQLPDRLADMLRQHNEALSSATRDTLVPEQQTLRFELRELFSSLSAEQKSATTLTEDMN